MDKKFEEWAKQVSTLHLPRWEELPDMDLYRDQVITLIERYLSFLANDDEKIITTSMINNYVKWKMMPAPNRKKQYNRVHLGYLIVITILKQVVNIKDIKNGIELLASQRGTHNAYNLFCLQMEISLKNVLALCVDSISFVEKYKAIEEDEIVLSMGTLSFASKLVAVKKLELENHEIKNKE